MISYEEYVKSLEEKSHSELGAINTWSEPKFTCPRCGGNVRKNLLIVCTSIPPKFMYQCENSSCCFTTYLNG